MYLGGDVPDISHTLAEQAKLAVAAEIAKAEWDAREKRALRERKEAIEAARWGILRTFGTLNSIDF